MPLDAIRNVAINIAKALREQAHANQWDSLATQLIVYRGETPAAVTVFRDLDGERLLRSFALASWGFDADTLVLIFEGWTTQLATNPATGEPWNVEDFELFDAVDKGWAHQAVVIICINRAGDMSTAELPYTVSNGIGWGPVVYDVIHLPARWDRLMRRAMDAPSGSVMLPDVTEPFSRLQRDFMTADLLQSSGQCIVHVISSEEPDVSELLRHTVRRKP